MSEHTDLAIIDQIKDHLHAISRSPRPSAPSLDVCKDLRQRDVAVIRSAAGHVRSPVTGHTKQ